MGEIDDAVMDKGPSIIDAHLYGLLIGQVFDVNHGPQSKRPVRGGHFLHIVDLSAGRGPTVEGMAVPARNTNLHRPRRHTRLPRLLRAASQTDSGRQHQTKEAICHIKRHEG